jgi:hypothetical protein
VIDKEDFSWDVSGMLFLSNKITNFAGLSLQEALMVKVYQVLMHKLLLMTNQFTLTICMSGEDMTLAEIQSTLMQLETTLV